MLRKIMLAAGTALLPTIALAATIDVTTADIPAGTNVEWTADNEYVLNGLVFVSEGSSLTIQPGTVIKGKPGQGENASALVVARGLWGGVIILGRASLNSEPGETPIEGIPTTEPRGIYGGDDDGDNSGVFRYVSIRHGGTDIGAGNEINGLTMGGVGSGTVIEYVEVYNNQDDGFEWFGGTVNTKYLVSALTATTPLTTTRGSVAKASSGS